MIGQNNVCVLVKDFANFDILKLLNTNIVIKQRLLYRLSSETTKHFIYTFVLTISTNWKSVIQGMWRACDALEYIF